jgi:glycosyltransferase involved in cell wall biosynthesis
VFRIAMIDPSLFTVPYDRALARALGDEGAEIVLFGRQTRPGENDADDIVIDRHFYRFAEGRTAHRLPDLLRHGLKAADHAVSMSRLCKRLRSWQPHAIHFQWLVLPMLDARFLKQLRVIAPLILTVHDTMPFNGNPSGSWQGAGFIAALRQFDMLIVHTEQGRARLIAAGLPEEHIRVIPHGRLLELPESVQPQAAEGPVRFLQFGKIKPYKGIDVLIDAFAAMPAELREQAYVHVVGAAYLDVGELREQAARLGVASRVVIEPRFVPDDEMAELFGPDAVAVFPYREIEASGVLSLALAHGRPVIASNIGCFAESIVDDVHGNLVPPGDSAALSFAMCGMVARRCFRQSCAAEAAELARSIPEWRAIARLTMDAYRGANANSAGAAPPTRSQPTRIPATQDAAGD